MLLFTSFTTKSEQQYAPTSTATFISSGELNRRLTQHALVNSLSEIPHDNRKVDHGIRHGEHDTSTNLSNLRFADDILLISGSLKHTTNVLDDLTTATRAQGLELHPRKQHDIKTQKK